MSLNFETKTEIKLNKAPLDEVVCQVKYSPILSISKNIPSEFQEIVRNRFPNYEAVQNFVFQVPGVGITQGVSLDAPPKSHDFVTKDRKSKISLTSDFFALSTKNYTHWAEFLETLLIIEKGIAKVYNISTATRIGLRFINRFTLKNSNLKTSNELLGLFRDELTCIIKAEPWKDPNESFLQLVAPDVKAMLAIRIGYGKQNRDPFFVLDFDYFEDAKAIPLKKFADKISVYHSRIYDAFRWCLKDESLVRFSPDLGQ